jgi:deoxyribodipyrimidine photo-lyase
MPQPLHNTGSSFPGDEPHPLACMEFRGGEKRAIKRLRQYVWGEEEEEEEEGGGGAGGCLSEGSDNLEEYFKVRNGLLGRDYSSKLSPWLALGCLSPRLLYWEVVR